MKTKKSRSEGFAIIVLLIASVLVILLSIYAYSKTMKRVENSMKEEFPEMNVPAPTPQNYQQTLDSVKQNLDDSAQREQQKINDAQNEIGN